MIYEIAFVHRSRISDKNKLQNGDVDSSLINIIMLIRLFTFLCYALL